MVLLINQPSALKFISLVFAVRLHTVIPSLPLIRDISEVEFDHLLLAVQDIRLIDKDMGAKWGPHMALVRSTQEGTWKNTWRHMIESFRVILLFYLIIYDNL